MTPNPRKPIPKAIREQVKAKFEGHCAYCGEKPEIICIDHLHPVARAYHLKEGEDINHIDNLMPACFSCNNYKISFSLEQFRRELGEQVTRAREYSVNFRLAERFGQIQINEKPIKFYFERVQAMGDL